MRGIGAGGWQTPVSAGVSGRAVEEGKLQPFSTARKWGAGWGTRFL